MKEEKHTSFHLSNLQIRRYHFVSFRTGSTLQESWADAENDQNGDFSFKIQFFYSYHKGENITTTSAVGLNLRQAASNWFEFKLTSVAFVHPVGWTRSILELMKGQKWAENGNIVRLQFLGYGAHAAPAGQSVTDSSMAVVVDSEVAKTELFRRFSKGDETLRHIVHLQFFGYAKSALACRNS